MIRLSFSYAMTPIKNLKEVNTKNNSHHDYSHSITFIDIFSGMGGFRAGMEQAGHICKGHCEIDKYANAVYNAIIHNRKDDEWYRSDITKIHTADIPKVDCWCFGFPCQGISIAGKQQGLEDKRSGLFYAVTDLIRNTKEENRPSYLFIENVKNLLSINRGFDFLSVLTELDEVGYDCEWTICDSVKFGVPQHRERIFIIGHLRGRCTRQIFPLGNENKQPENKIIKVGNIADADSQANRIYSPDGISPTLNTCSGGRRVPMIVKNGTKKGYAEANVGDSIQLTFPHSTTRRGRVGKGVAHTLDTACNQGVYDGERIRRLTPLECFRLQGFTDEQFARAKTAVVNGKPVSDSQLYKMAGNAVTVKVIYEIARKLEVLK